MSFPKRNKLKILAAAVLASLTLAGCGEEELGWEVEANARKDRQVRENMAVAKKAVEDYAAAHAGSYPLHMDVSAKSYFPGGEPEKKPAPFGLVNPFSGENEFPAMDAVPPVSELRLGDPIDIEKGRIIYNVVENGKGYVIVGGDHKNKAITQEGSDQVLVYSNAL